MGTQIHAASEADIEDLQHFITQLFAEAPPGIYRRAAPTLEEEREFVRSRILPINSTLLVARLDGEVVGVLDFLGGTLAEETHVGTFGLSVGRENRGQGIGTALVEELLIWAQVSGIRRIEVRAFANNPRAISLYERLGFVREGLLREAIVTDGETIDVVLLARLLSP